MSFNLIIFFIFLGFYYPLYQPLYDETKFRLSGHVLVTLCASNILINLDNLIDLFDYYKISNYFLTVFRVIIYTLLVHNLYVIIWTTGYFHTFWESMLSLLIGIIVLYAFNSFCYDKEIKQNE